MLRFFNPHKLEQSPKTFVTEFHKFFLIGKFFVSLISISCSFMSEYKGVSVKMLTTEFIGSCPMTIQGVDHVTSTIMIPNTKYLQNMDKLTNN